MSNFKPQPEDLVIELVDIDGTVVQKHFLTTVPILNMNSSAQWLVRVMRKGQQVGHTYLTCWTPGE